MLLLSSHLIGDHLFDFGATAAVYAAFYACSLCQERVFPSCPDFGSAPRAHADRENKWRHIEHLLFKCPAFWAREVRWRLCSSGMTSLRNVLGLSMCRRCCLRHFLLIVPLLWLPRLVSYRSSSTLLLPWHVHALGA